MVRKESTKSFSPIDGQMIISAALLVRWENPYRTGILMQTHRFFSESQSTFFPTVSFRMCQWTDMLPITYRQVCSMTEKHCTVQKDKSCQFLSLVSCREDPNIQTDKIRRQAHRPGIQSRHHSSIDLWPTCRSPS